MVTSIERRQVYRHHGESYRRDQQLKASDFSKKSRGGEVKYLGHTFNFTIVFFNIAQAKLDKEWDISEIESKLKARNNRSTNIGGTVEEEMQDHLNEVV